MQTRKKGRREKMTKERKKKADTREKGRMIVNIL
jgi:hypothetical protein